MTWTRSLRDYGLNREFRPVDYQVSYVAVIWLLPDVRFVWLCVESYIQHSNRVYGKNTDSKPWNTPVLRIHKELFGEVKGIGKWTASVSGLNVGWVTLGCWEPVGGPAERMSIQSQERVLLLHAEPQAVLRQRLHHFVASVAVVGFCRTKKWYNLFFRAAQEQRRGTETHQLGGGCTWEPRRGPACWGRGWKGPWTWRRGRGTCRCWSPRTGRC